MDKNLTVVNPLVKRIFSILLTFVLVFGMIPAPTFALPDGVTITNPGNDPMTTLPASLQNGELWTDKSVSYLGSSNPNDPLNGTFEINLRAIGQEYMISNPQPQDNLDVVLVLDTSGSMDDDNKLENMQSAAKNAVETLLSVNGNRVAIVKYSRTASEVRNFSTNENQLKDDIDDLDANGGTNIQHAFYVAQQMILNRPSNNDDRRPVIILMSDGRPTYYYDGLYSPSKTRLGTGNGNDTDGEYVWNTILQANEAKNNIPDLRIYTIGFGVGSDAYAIATLMPTDANTSGYRPNGVFSGELRSRLRSMEVPYYWDNGQWNESGYYSTRNDQTVYGNWTAFSGYTSEPDNYWNAYSTDFNNQIDPFSSFGYNYAYFLRSRTGEEYRNVVGQQIPFNHKYWEDESSITSSSAQDIFDAFVEIVNELLVMKPNDKVSANEYSDIVIKDVIGSAFEIVGTLPSGVTESGGVVTWTLDGTAFEAMPPDLDNTPNPLDTNYLYSVTFRVKIKDDSLPGYYETNDNSASELVNRSHGTFIVAEDNPNYSESGAIYQELLNTGWLTLIAPPVSASITITKSVTGPVTNVARTFSFTLYDAPTGGQVVSGPIDISVTGASSNTGTFSFEIPYNGFTNNQVTYYVQEDNSSEPSFWNYDNSARKAVTITRANPVGSKTFTNSYAPTGTLVVDKVWTGDGTDTAASFKLYKKVNGDWVPASQAGYSIDTSSPSTAQVTISNLSLDTEYKVIEDPMQDYTVSYSPETIIFSSADLIAGNGTLEKNITITNEYHKPIGEITINKVWSDSENIAGDRPEELTFNIVGPQGYDGPSSITLKESEGWTKVFETEVFGTYQFTEVLPLDYVITENTQNPQSQSIAVLPVGDRTASLTFSNTYVEPKGSLTVKKTWANEDEFYASYRPLSITIKLYKDGEDTGLSVDLPETDATPWEHTFTDLPFGEYSVEEISVPDYTVSYSDNVVLRKFDDNQGITARTGQINITNTFNNPKGSIVVSKTWVETDVDASVVRPSSIVVSLKKDGNEVDTAELNAGNSWMATFSDLLLDNGVYTVSESSLEAEKLSMYDPEFSYSANVSTESDLLLGPSSRSGTIAITNTYAKGTITVNKVWVDGDNPQDERPTAAVVTLHKITVLPDLIPEPIQDPEDPENPEALIYPDPIPQAPTDEIVGTLTITRPVNAPVVFYNLELGDHISYYVTENEIPFYGTSINKSSVVLNENNQNDSFTVTNTYSDPKGSLTVNKTWDHGNNPNQPTDVTVYLYEDGEQEPVAQATFSTNYTFTGLDLGKVYTISEQFIDNYSPDYNGFVSYTPVKGQNSIASGSATITNTYIPQLNDLTVNKEWVDRVGDPITVTLYRSVGEGLTLVGTVDLNSENDWSHEFTGLEIYGPGGVRYTYSVAENGVGLSLYDADTSETVQLNVEVPSEITITNTYSPNKGELTITKEWLGLDEEEMTPPVDSVEVRLIINGEPEETNMILNAQNNWTVVRSGLNAENTYSVEEVTTFEEFDVSYSASDISFDAENLEKAVVITNQRTEDEPSIDVNKSISNALVQLSAGTATFNYSVELINNGNRTLNALRVEDVMTGPEGAAMTYAPTPTSQDENGAVFELEGSLKPGEKVVFNYSVTVNLAGTYENTATGFGYYVETEVSDDGAATGVATNPPTPDPDPDPDPTPQGVVNVTFVDTNGATLSPGYQMAGSVGTNYVTSARDILGYALVETPANANGTFIDGTLSVVYVYDLEEEIVTTEEVPLGEATTEPTTEEEVIVDEGTPLGEALPQTGQLPPELYYGIGSIITAAGVFLKRKNK